MRRANRARFGLWCRILLNPPTPQPPPCREGEKEPEGVSSRLVSKSPPSFLPLPSVCRQVGRPTVRLAGRGLGVGRIDLTRSTEGGSRALPSASVPARGRSSRTRGLHRPT